MYVSRSPVYTLSSIFIHAILLMQHFSLFLSTGYVSAHWHSYAQDTTRTETTVSHCPSTRSQIESLAVQSQPHFLCFYQPVKPCLIGQAIRQMQRQPFLDRPSTRSQSESFPVQVHPVFINPSNGVRSNRC